MKMTTEVRRKFDTYIFDIMLNHKYFPFMNNKQWNLIMKMTTEVRRKFDTYIFDIMLNHKYFPFMYNKQRIRIMLDNLALLFYGK